MSENFPMPGDTIELTYHRGERYVVVECPEVQKNHSSPGDAWFVMDKRTVFASRMEYRIIVRGGGRTDVDQYLKKQRDDNLRSVFC